MSIWCERQHEHFFLWLTDRIVGNVCVKEGLHTQTGGYSVFSHCLDVSSRSVGVTDEHASALRGISLKWFRITWALRLWSLAAACAVLEWYYIIYNNIIDHYVSWHSTLNRHWFISQMMKGERNSEIKGRARKTQTFICCQHKRWDSLSGLHVSIIISQAQCKLWGFCIQLIKVTLISITGIQDRMRTCRLHSGFKMINCVLISVACKLYSLKPHSLP